MPAKVSQSILCIFFSMYVATIQCLNYSEQVCKNTQFAVVSIKSVTLQQGQSLQTWYSYKHSSGAV